MKTLVMLLIFFSLLSSVVFIGVGLMMVLNIIHPAGVAFIGFPSMVAGWWLVMNLTEPFMSVVYKD